MSGSSELNCVCVAVLCRVTAVSRCFRAETSDIAEEKGIYRVHQFTKVGPSQLWWEISNNNSNNDDNNDCIERHNSRFLQSPHCTINSLQHVCWSSQGTTVCKSHATHLMPMMCSMLCATWYEGTVQLLSLAEFRSHLFLIYSVGWNH